MSTSDAPVGETLEHFVARFLRTVPQTWTEYDVSALSELEERALFLLTGAGMIERRTSLRLQMFGHPVAVEATITLTGECGFAEAMEYVSARMWDDWREVFEKRQASDQKDAPAFHCERIGKEQWRLTAEGLVAKNDLDNGGSSVVFDFVLMRGFFDGRPRLMPDGRISRREPVRGQGKLEKMTLVNPNAAPAGVNIANWEDGGKAFAAAFAELVKSHAATPNETQQGEGEKPKPNATTEAILPALLSASDIAARINRKRESVTSFLTRFAEKYPDCRVENPSKRKNEPGYLYRTADVWPALEKWMKGNGEG